jgi:hypothetical protein
MLITKKDRSFILLMISLILITSSIFSLFSHLKTPTYNQNHKILSKQKYWLNLTQKPSNKDLKSKIILLSFLSDSETNLEQLIDTRNLKNNFNRDLSVISVYNGKEGVVNIQKLSDKMELKFPIIFDKHSDILTHFKPKNNQFILLNAKGEIYNKYQLKDFNKINVDITELITTSENIKRENFKISHKKTTLSYILSNPTSLNYIDNIKIGNYKGEAILISNSGHNNIIISSLDGKIIKKIGSIVPGFVDGSLSDTRFNQPQDFAIDKNIIYVADSGNHSIRKVDIKTGKTTTIIGSGDKKGSHLQGTIGAKKANLWFPTDLALSADKKHLVISNYGANQILSYDIKNKTLQALTKETLKIKAKNIISHKDRVYFLDQNTIKYLDKNNQMHIFQINKKSFESDAFYIDKNILFSINNNLQIMQKINLTSGQVNETTVNHNRVSDLININNFIYLLDSKNNKITIINKKNSNQKIFNILPKLEITSDKIIKYLPNFNLTDEIFVKSNNNINIKMKLKENWKINHEAPSFINLVEIDKDKKASLIKIYNWQDIEKNQIKLPKLKNGFTYYIEAIIYYCKNIKNSICMVNKYNKKINVSPDTTNKEIKIDFLYPDNE